MKQSIKRCILAALLVMPFKAFPKTEQNVNFMHDGLQVHARLALPTGNGPFKLIIIDPGSGPNDKDGTLPMSGGNASCLYPGLNGTTLKPYKGLSDAFSDSGYAVLTYDKLEYTYSSGLGVMTLHKLWYPIESAIKYVKTRTDIDTNNIILLGHSEGSSFIPSIARNTPSVKALISLAGPRTPLDSILAYQLKYITQTCNGDTAAANAQAAQVLQYFSDIRSGNWNSSTPAAFGAPANVWSDYLKVVDSVSINYNLANRPTLFVGLGNDINVPIATELNRFQQEVNINADFYTVPGVNHYLTTPTNPATSKVVTDTILYWLRRNVSTAVPAVLNTQTNAFTTRLVDRKLTINALEPIKELVLYNMEGKIIFRKEMNTKDYELDLASYPPMIYMLSVSGKKQQQTIKIPVQ